MGKRIIEVPLDGEQVVLVEVDDEDFYQGGDALAPVANVDEMLARAGGSVRSAMDNVIMPTMHTIFDRITEFGGGRRRAAGPPDRGQRQQRFDGAGVDLGTGNPVGDPFTGHTDQVTAVAVGELRRPPGRGQRQPAIRRCGCGTSPPAGIRV